MNIGRRGFLKFLGIGAAAAAVLPMEELIDRLAFARAPTSSLYITSAGVRVDNIGLMFVHYLKGIEDSLNTASLFRSSTAPLIRLKPSANDFRVHVRATTINER